MITPEASTRSGSLKLMLAGGMASTGIGRAMSGSVKKDLVTKFLMAVIIELRPART